MRVHVRYVLSAAAVLLAGCESATVSTAPVAGVSFEEQQDHQREAVTGAGELDLSALGLGLARFSYDVQLSGGGHASGDFHQRFELDGKVVDFTGEATCVAIDPVNHRAWVGGIIERNRSTHPDYQDPALFSHGKDIWFRAVDYGHGRGPTGQADRSTIFGFIGSAGFNTSAEYCAGRPWPDGDARTRTVVKGAVRIDVGEQAEDRR